MAGLASYTWFVADGLASGSLLSLLLRTSVTRRQIAKVSFTLFAIALAAAAGGASYGILTRRRLLGAALQHSVIDLLFSALLLLFLLARTAPWGKLVTYPVLRFVGQISYGLYLVHLLVFGLYDKLSRRFPPSLLPTDGHFSRILLRFAVAGGAAIVIAYLSRRFLEERFLRLKDRWTPAIEETVPRISLPRQDSSRGENVTQRAWFPAPDKVMLLPGAGLAEAVPERAFPN